jgi:undecaprenyl-diphosphatase
VPRRESGLTPRLLLGAAAAAALSIPFVLLMLLVLSEWEPLAGLDRDVADGLNDVALGKPVLADVLRAGSVATDPWVFRAVVVAVALWLWSRGARRLATWAVVTTTAGGLLGVLLKLLVERARPAFPEPVTTASGYSFPSGHALNSLLCCGVLLVVGLPLLTPRGRYLAWTAAGTVVLATGYDRIGLGVHYVSDVLAGWAAALAVLAGTLVAFGIWRRETGRAPAGLDAGVDPEEAAALRGSRTADG